jgi:hypothetical protein
MAPTLLDGERALVPRYETWAVRLGLLAWERGDVVYFRSPRATPRTLLERLTGGPFLIKRVAATARARPSSCATGRCSSTAPVPSRSRTRRARRLREPRAHARAARAPVRLGRQPLAARLARLARLRTRAEPAWRGARWWVVWPLVRHDQDGAKRLESAAAAVSAAPSGATARRPGVRGRPAVEARGARLHRVQDELHVLPQVDAELLGAAAHVVA